MRNWLAGFAALAMLSIGLTVTSAREGVTVPPPEADAALAAAGTPARTAVLAGGCFWGVQAVFQHVRGVTRATSGYAGGAAIDGALRDGRHRPHRPRRIRADHLRPLPDHLRPAPPRVLQRRARSDDAQPAGAGQRHAIPIGDLLPGRGPGTHRARLRRAARSRRTSSRVPSSPRSRSCRRSTRPRTTTRTTRRCTPTTPTSSSTTPRRSRT